MSVVTASPIGKGVTAADLLDYLFKPGIAGGQVAYGGTNAGDILDLWGADAAPDTGIVRVNSPISLAYDTFANTTPAQQFAMVWNPTVSITGSYIGGCLSVATVWNVSTGVFIPATFSDTSRVNVGAVPGFSAFTFINELAVIANDGNFNLPSALVMNIGLTHERNTSGTSTTPGTTALSFSPSTRTTVSGAVLTKTEQTAVRVSPTYSTVSGSTVNLGTIYGVRCFQPAAGLFQPGAGVENMTAYYGLYMPNMTFGGGAATYSTVRSLLNAGTNKRFLDHTGTAQSRIRGSIFMDVDNVGIFYGASNDVVTYWNGTNNAYRVQFVANTASLLYDNPAANELRMTGVFPDSDQLQMNFRRFSFGGSAPTGANWYMLVAPPNLRQVSVSGEYSDVLFSQAGALDIDGNTMSDVQNWKLNIPSILLNGGTIDDLSNLYVQGQSSFGATRVQALRVQGRTRIDGHLNLGDRDAGSFSTQQDDLSLGANNGQRTINRIEGSSPFTITGIDSSFGFGQAGDYVALINDGSETITITNQDAASLAANRVITNGAGDFLLGPDEIVWFWYDTGISRWRMDSTNAGQLKTLHLSGDQFRKGATAPTDVTIGTTPTVPALLFDATNELASLYHSFPVDVDLTKDMILRIQFSLAAAETNGDTCDFTMDYTVPTIVTANGIAKASTQVTGQFTAVTGRLAAGDVYEMDIVISAGDATNPLASGLGIAFEVHLTNTTGVAAIHLIDGDLIYTSLST